MARLKFCSQSLGMHFKDGRYVSLNHKQSLTQKEKENISDDSGYVSEEEPEKKPVIDILCCRKELVQEGLVQERINHFKQLNEHAQKIEPKTRLTQITHQTARTGMTRG